MIACFLPSPNFTVDVSRKESAGDHGAKQEMIDAQPGVVSPYLKEGGTPGNFNLTICAATAIRVRPIVSAISSIDASCAKMLMAVRKQAIMAV